MYSSSSMDVLRSVNTDEIERILAGIDATEGLSPDELEELARRVWALLRRELVIEQERLGRTGV